MISRRLFLRNTAAAGAVGAAVVAPVVVEATPPLASSNVKLTPFERLELAIEEISASGPPMGPRERAIWHMRQLEKLVRADGGDTPYIAVSGFYDGKCRLIGIYHEGGSLMDSDGMFAGKGGAV